MSRGSFSRSVARAAASGGGKAYRARAPIGWYFVMTLICVLGVSLIVYSRNEALHPTAAKTVGPTATDNWHVALGIDICGKLEPALAATPSAALATTGVRTFGDGLIDIDPAAAKTPADFEGAKATLGLFAANYPGLSLSNTAIEIPGKGQRKWANGDVCTGPLHGRGTLVAETWSSTSAVGHRVTKNITGIHLDDGEMITVGFVPAGANLPVPASKAALVQTLGTSSSSSTTTSGGRTITVKPIVVKPSTSKSTTSKSTTSKPTTSKTATKKNP